MRVRLTRSGVIAAFTLITIAGCSLTSTQRQDIARWEAEAVAVGHPEVRYIEHIDPQLATGLGFLPFGIGGFYSRRPGLGAAGILCWPLSITWEPALASKGANEYNYEDYHQRMMHLREETVALRSTPRVIDDELRQLERLRDAGKISEAEYRDLRLKTLDALRQSVDR